jgi:hypothetical protein
MSLERHQPQLARGVSSSTKVESPVTQSGDGGSELFRARHRSIGDAVLVRRTP